MWVVYEGHKLAKSECGKFYGTNCQVSSVNEWHGKEGEKWTALVQKRLKGNLSTRFKVWNILESRLGTKNRTDILRKSWKIEHGLGIRY